MGLLGKAKEIVNKVVHSGMKVPACTWDELATLYYKDNQIEKAVDAMTRALFLLQRFSLQLNRISYIAWFE